MEHQAQELEELISRDIGDLELTDEGLGGEGEEPEVIHHQEIAHGNGEVCMLPVLILCVGECW